MVCCGTAIRRTARRCCQGQARCAPAGLCHRGARCLLRVESSRCSRENLLGRLWLRASCPHRDLVLHGPTDLFPRRDLSRAGRHAAVLSGRLVVRSRCLLRRLGELRKFLVETDPGLRTGRPDVQHRCERGSIVQRREPNRRELRVGFALREQGSATVPAKPAGGHLSAACADSVGLRSAEDFEVRTPDDDARCKWSAARTLAVTAMAVQHRNGRTGASIAYAPAGALSGERGSHSRIIRWPRTTRSSWRERSDRLAL
jgi:hypothetical protein